MKIIDKNIPWIILFIIMLQNPIWPFWSVGFKLSYLLLLLLLLNKFKHIFYILRNNKISLNATLLFAVLIIMPFFTGLMYSNFIYLFSYLIAFTIPREHYIKSFELLSKTLAIISLISFIPWFINTYLYPLFPLYNIIDISQLKGTQCLMENYVFYVKYNDLFESFRFYSMFDEPGVFGTLTAFVLYGNKYDFSKWYLWPIFIASLFTFSMAFYVLTLIGFLLSKFRFNPRSLLFFLVVISIIIIVINLLKDDAMFQDNILDRFVNLSGSLEGRTDYEAQKKLESIMWTSDFFTGIGKTAMDMLYLRQGESASLFVLERGFLTVLALVSCYLSFINKFTKSSLLLLFLFLLSFLQRPFLITTWQMLLFCCICAYITFNNQNQNDYK